MTNLVYPLQTHCFYQIENEIVYKTFPDGTNEKIVIDGQLIFQL
jgi:hypothetical protein